MEQTEQVKKATSLLKTKKALIASAVCTFLCGLLLLSTSIAWFSDTQDSGANELYAGNLDIVLSYSKTMETNDWHEVKNTTDDIFEVNGKPMLWEPGAVNVVYFKVENKGSLAAKYDFALEIDSEVEGTNFNEAPNNKFKLSDYIKGGVVELTAESTVYADRNVAIADISENEKTLQQIHTGAPLLTGTLTGVPETGTETAGNTEKVFALVLYMPDDTGDVTNYKTGEGNKPTLKLKVKLIATQTVGETDSFGNEYDKDAYTKVDGVSYVKNAEALTKALSEATDNERIKLTDDISAPDGIVLDKNIELDLGQKTIEGGSSATINIMGSNVISVSNGTIDGYISVNGECSSISNVKFVGSGEYAIRFDAAHDGKTCNISDLDFSEFAANNDTYIYVAKGTVYITGSNITADKIAVVVDQDKYTATVNLNGENIAEVGQEKS